MDRLGRRKDLFIIIAIIGPEIFSAEPVFARCNGWGLAPDYKLALLVVVEEAYT